MRALGALIHDGDPAIPEAVRASLMPLVVQIAHLDEAIRAIDADMAVQARADPVSNRLMTIPGIGPITASALVATIGDPASFSGPREFAGDAGAAGAGAGHDDVEKSGFGRHAALYRARTSFMYYHKLHENRQ